MQVKNRIHYPTELSNNAFFVPSQVTWSAGVGNREPNPRHDLIV